MPGSYVVPVRPAAGELIRFLARPAARPGDRYPGHHAFLSSDRKNVHDEASAKLAWGRMTAFFRKHLA